MTCARIRASRAYLNKIELIMPIRINSRAYGSCSAHIRQFHRRRFMYPTAGTGYNARCCAYGI